MKSEEIMNNLYLNKLSLVQFKNYQEASLAFSPKINCFVGDNGVGKTNLLDAIHYLSLTKSFFNNIDQQNILHGKDFFVLQGEFVKKGHSEKVFCSVRQNKKKIFKRNNKDYERFADHIGLFPVVMISPADSSLILEGSEQRRRFMDTVISLYDKQYLHALIRYNRALLQRNKLLKQFEFKRENFYDELELWDTQLVVPGNEIYQKRKEFIEKVIPVFQQYYNTISEEKEKVGLEYRSQLHESNFETLLVTNRDKDRVMQFSTVGVHKDDLMMSLNDHPLKKTGSQGQQKTFLVALKFAKFGFIRDLTHTKPILLLDDIFDKFDAHRVSQIIRMVAQNEFGQIFITDTQLEHLENILQELDTDYKVFKINEEIKTVIPGGET